MKRILVVDDELHIRTAIAALLESDQNMDVEVVMAEDCRQAFDYLCEQQVDLAIVDLRFPDTNRPWNIDNDAGIHLIQAMADQYPDLPVVVLTARRDMKARTQCMVSTKKGYMVKPIQPERFLRAIRQLLGPSPLDNIREYQLRNSNVVPTEAYALARIENHNSDQSFYLGNSYTLLAGINPHLPEEHQSVSILLPTKKNPIDLEIIVYAEDMKIEPSWLQRYRYDRSSDPTFVSFYLTPLTPGPKNIVVEFLYHLHWLTNIRMEIEVKATSELLTNRPR